MERVTADRSVKVIDTTNICSMFPEDRNVSAMPWTPGMTVADVVAPFRERLARRGHGGEIVAVSIAAGPLKQLTEGVDMTPMELNEMLRPGDCVTLFVRVAGGDVWRTVAGIAVMIVAAAATWYVGGSGAFLGVSALGYGSFAGALAGAAVMTVGGLLVNSVFPAASASSEASSPTYGWNGYYNSVAPGASIPIAVGQCAPAPQIINQHFTASDDNGQWAWMLFAIAQGYTANVPTADTILVGDEVLASYSTSYFIGATSGDLTITDGMRSALSPFHQVHHYRKLDKALTYDSSYIDEEAMTLLLHCDGISGATTLTDAARAVTWTCRDGAHIGTTSPFLGSGALDLTTSGAYVDSDDLEALRMPGNFCFECRIYRASDVSNGIFYQEAATESGDALRVSLAYRGGEFVFQASRISSYGVYGDSSDASYYSEWELVGEVSAAVSIPTGAWAHVAAQGVSGTARLYVNGTLAGEGSCSLDYSWPESLSAYEYAPMAYANLPSAMKSRCVNRIGYARIVDYAGYSYPDASGVAEEDLAVAEIFGNCRLDEVRVTRGAVYEWDGFTPPTGELGNPFQDSSDEDQVSTIGACNAAKLMVECPYGLYKLNDEGGLKTYSVDFRVSYRTSDGGAWTHSTATLSDRSRSWVRRQFDVTFPARGEYDVRIKRITADDGDNSKLMSTTQLTGFDQINDFELAYPGIQCLALGIKASDSLSGQVPAVRVVNAYTAFDAPSWDGSGRMAIDPTCPAWLAYYMLTEEKSGRGISPTRISQAKWAEWADWTERTVDGQRRAQFNGVFDGSPGSLKTALNHVENVGRAKVIPMGQQYSVVIDKPDVARGLYTYGKIKPGSFKVSWLPRSEKADEIEVEYYDRNKVYAARSVYARASDYGAITWTPKSSKITLIGCNNREQAQREAIFRMQKTELTTRTVKFSVPVEAVVMEPGAIVRVQHDSNKMTFGGLLAADANGASITLDRAITLDSATFGAGVKAWVRDMDDNILERAITGPFDEETNVFELDEAVAASRWDPYAIGRPNEESWLYRITRFELEKDEWVTITASEYVEAIYYHENYGGGTVAI